MEQLNRIDLIRQIRKAQLKQHIEQIGRSQHWVIGQLRQGQQIEQMEQIEQMGHIQHIKQHRINRANLTNTTNITHGEKYNKQYNGNKYTL